jgi:hypothetical protein
MDTESNYCFRGTGNCPPFAEIVYTGMVSVSGNSFSLSNRKVVPGVISR